MHDYEELVKALREQVERHRIFGLDTADDTKLMDDAADAIEKLMTYEALYRQLTENGQTVARKLIDAYPKWISVEEPPDNDRNIFICHGSTDFKAPCIGHYDPGMKLFYEDKNWFASPIYDAMFWCEMPKLPLPEPPKEDDNA